MLTACNENVEEENEEPKLFYETLPMPSEKFDKTVKNARNEERAEYILYVKEFSYQKFYEYIMSLEKLDFNYKFVNESVPKKQSDLVDSTETSWAADNGEIWIRAQWRSKDNQYYSGYNLQLIFDNYDYIKPLEPVEEKNDEEKTE